MKNTLRTALGLILAFALLIVGIVAMTPLIIQTAFAEQQILEGGGYSTTYNFTSELFFKNLQLFASLLSVVIAAVMLFLHIIQGKRWLLIAGCLFSLLSIASLLLLPADIRSALYRYEFLNYRQSFMWHIFYEASAEFDIFIQSLKYIPLLASGILTLIGLIKQRKLPEDAEN